MVHVVSDTHDMCGARNMYVTVINLIYWLADLTDDFIK